MADSKKKRTPKTSKGIHGGGGKVKLSVIEKALMGKGLVDSTKVADSQPWRGAREKA
jgi:hypothetical protein